MHMQLNNKFVHLCCFTILFSANLLSAVDKDIIAHWNFDEGQGSLLHDISGNGNDGTIYGASWTEGKYGQALSFDGVNDYVNCGNSASVNMHPPLSIEAWVFPYDTASECRMIVSKGDKAFRNYRLDLYNGRVRFIVEGFDPHIIESNAILEPDKWQHIVAVHDGTSSRIYINSLLDISVDVSGGSTVNSPSPLTIGIEPAYRNYPYYWKGLLDEVTIHKRALTANEIRESYNLFKEKSKNKKAPDAESKGNTAQVKIADNNGNGEINSFIKSSSKIPAPVSSHSSVVNNGYLYITGGSNSSDTVYYAKINPDGSLGSFATSPNKIPVSLYAHSSVVCNGYLYITGGWNVSSAQQNTVYYAKINSDGSIGSFTTSPNKIPASLYAHSSVVNNGYLYITGGSSRRGQQNTVYYAKINSDGSIGSFTTSTNNIPTNLTLHSSVVNNGYLYITGGNTGSSNQNTLYYAKINSDGSIESFTTSTNKIPASLYGHVSVVYNGYLYITGGSVATGTLNTVYYAKINSDGSIGNFTTSPNKILVSLLGHSSVVNNGYLYITGGNSGGGHLDTVYYTSFCGGDKLAKSESKYNQPQDAKPEGLVARWNFDEGSGNILNDKSGKGNDGTIYGASWDEGKYGQALNFDGSNDYVDCGSEPDLLPTNSVTYSLWVNPAVMDVNRGIVVSDTKYNGGFNLFTIWNTHTYRIYANINGVLKLYGGPPVNVGQWTYLVATYDGSTIRLYVNGIEYGSGLSAPGTIIGSTKIRIAGTTTGTVSNWKGLIDETVIYNRALTATEIRQLYTSTANSAMTKSEVKPAAPVKQRPTKTVKRTNPDGKRLPFLWVSLPLLIFAMSAAYKWMKIKKSAVPADKKKLSSALLGWFGAGLIFVWIMASFRFIFYGGRFPIIELITHNPLLRLFPLFRHIIVIHTSQGSLSNSISYFIARGIVLLMPFVIIGGILLNALWLIRTSRKAAKRYWMKNAAGIAIFTIIGLLYFPHHGYFNRSLRLLERYYLRTPAAHQELSVKHKTDTTRSKEQNQEIALSNEFITALSKYEKGKYKSALRGFKKMLDKAPDNKKTIIKNNIAAAYIKLGKYATAEQYLKELQQDSYTSVHISLNRAYLYFKMGELERSYEEALPAMTHPGTMRAGDMKEMRNWFQSLSGNDLAVSRSDLAAKLILTLAKNLFVDRKSSRVTYTPENSSTAMYSLHRSEGNNINRLKGINISDAGFAFVDADNDNKNDLVYAAEDGLKIIYGRTLHNRGDFHFDDANSVKIVPEQNDTAKIGALCAGDFNGDGIEDIFFTIVYDDKAQADKLCGIYGGTRITGDWSFNATYPDVYLTSSEKTGLSGSKLQSGDFNGDGIDDIAVTGGGLCVYYGGAIPSAGDILNQSSVNLKFKTEDELGCLADLDGTVQSDYVSVKAGEALYINGKKIKSDSIRRAVKIERITALDLDGDRIDEIALFISGEKIDNIGCVKRGALYILKLNRQKPNSFEEYVYALGGANELKNVFIAPASDACAESLYVLYGTGVFNLQGERDYFVKNKNRLAYAKDYLLVKPSKECPFDDKYPLIFGEYPLKFR
ncbi:hypothetical protein KJ959_04155 [bacterium]|nr:hypothetical protein [bacterium]